MRATVAYGAGDVRVGNVPDARLVEPSDASIRVDPRRSRVHTRACICGSDLWSYNRMEHSETGLPMCHETIGVVGPDAEAATIGLVPRATT